MAKGETILREHHVVRGHLRLTQSVLREPEQEAISLFATDRRLFRFQSVLIPNRPPSADEDDHTVIDEIPLKKISFLRIRQQIRWGEMGVGTAMCGLSIILASWLSITGPFMIGLGAAGILHGLLLPTRWIEIKTLEPVLFTGGPILIYALRKRSARDLVQFLQVKTGS